MIWTVLVVLLILMILGYPNMPYYRGNAPYGWGPSGLLGLILIILLILVLLGRV
jgi:hypothetical protein